MSGTLNDHAISRASIVLPRWGIWWADVQVITSDVLSGTVDLAVNGLTLKGTIASGAPYRDVGWYRIVGGANGWGTVIPASAWNNAAGVKLSTPLENAARLCGETMATIPPTTKIGPAWPRVDAEASYSLDLLVPESWYVDEQGVTQLGARAPSTFSLPYTLLRSAPDLQLVTVSADDISTLIPGATLEGLEASSIRHELTPDGIRSHVWGLAPDGGDRLSDAFDGLVRGATRHTDGYRRCEYKVARAADDGYLDLRPARPSLGYPDLANVPMRSGIPGGGGSPAIGSTVLVGFVDGDLTRPFALDYEGEAGASWLPSTARIDASEAVELGESAALVALAGGDQFVALANLVKLRFQEVVGPLINTSPVPNDGGAAIQTQLKIELSAAGWNVITAEPPNLAAQKVKAT